MDNFDKLNGEFADKARGGFKYWCWLVVSYAFVVLGIGFAVFSFTEAAGNVGMYFNLLTLLCGLFGLQANSWAKGTQPRNQVLKISFIANLVVAAVACVILYIIMPQLAKK